LPLIGNIFKSSMSRFLLVAVIPFLLSSAAANDEGSDLCPNAEVSDASALFQTSSKLGSGFSLSEVADFASDLPDAEIKSASNDSLSWNSVGTMLEAYWNVAVQPVLPDVLAWLLAACGFALTRQVLLPLLKSSAMSAAKVVDGELDVKAAKSVDEVVAPAEESYRCIQRPSKVNTDEARDMFGCTDLHIATHQQDIDEVCRLLEGGSDPNALDTFNETPLHMAARFGFDEAVDALLQCGAKTDLKNRDGKTPLEIARMRGEVEVCELLQAVA
jgi:hypothetical protein